MRHFKIHIFFLLVLMTSTLSAFGRDGGDSTKQEKMKESIEGYLSTDNFIRDIVNHSAFKGFGELLLPLDDNTSYHNTRLSNVGTLMPYHSHVSPDVVVDALNHMIEDVDREETIFYDIYTEQEKQQDPSKRNTGIFFYRGKPNAPFAMICPGGGFSYVGSLHEGFPLAQQVSELGFNAFVIRYRIGGERVATEDLAAAISFVSRNAKSLGVSPKDYSIWGSSAGARMVGNIAMNGVSAYGGDELPKPATAIIAYTGQSSYSEDFPPTFINVAANDNIVNPSVVDQRVENMKKAGVDVEYQRYKTAGHGFGLGTGTDAEGWLDLAVIFWTKYIKQ